MCVFFCVYTECTVVLIICVYDNMHAIRFRVGSMLLAGRLLNASIQPTATVYNSRQSRFANLLPL